MPAIPVVCAAPPRDWRRPLAAAFPLAAACLLAALAAAPAHAKADFDWPDWPALEARYPGAGAVCLLDETDARLEYLGGDTYGKRVRVHSAFAILDPAQADEYLDWTIPNGEGHRLTSLDARTWTGPDRRVDVKGGQMFDVTLFSDYLLYQDIRGRRFAFPAVAPRTVIEIEYEYTSPWNFHVEHVFAGFVPTLVSRVRLLVPDKLMEWGLNLNYRSYRCGEPARRHVPTPRGQAAELIWELRDQPAIARELRMPPRAEVAPRLRLAPLPPRWARASWATIGADYYREYFAPRLETSPEIQALAVELTAGRSAPDDRARAIYDFVRGQVRYVAIELGVGAIQPHRAGEVLRMRYGDCKDKVCLFLSLLRAAGLPGSPALVRSAPSGEVDSVLFDVGQFDHMIAWLPMGDRGWWLDPTAATCPSDYLPALDQGTLALVLDDGAGRFLPTPVYPAEANRVECELGGTLATDGALAGRLAIRAVGAPAMEYAYEFRSGDEADRRAMAERLLQERIPGARLSRFSAAGGDSLGRPFLLTCEIERAAAAVGSGQALVLPGDFLALPAASAPLFADKRENPILYDYLEQEVIRVRLRLPEGFHPEPRAKAAVDGDFFTFRERAGEDAGEAWLERTFASQLLAIRPREYARGREAAELIRRAWTSPWRFSSAR